MLRPYSSKSLANMCTSISVLKNTKNNDYVSLKNVRMDVTLWLVRSSGTNYLLMSLGTFF